MPHDVWRVIALDMPAVAAAGHGSEHAGKAATLPGGAFTARMLTQCARTGGSGPWWSRLGLGPSEIFAAKLEKTAFWRARSFSETVGMNKMKRVFKFPICQI